mgnify:CR=1 FL=1
MSENILCVKNIKKSFGGVHALKGVDLTIKKEARSQRSWERMDVENQLL